MMKDESETLWTLMNDVLESIVNSNIKNESLTEGKVEKTARKKCLESESVRNK